MLTLRTTWETFAKKEPKNSNDLKNTEKIQLVANSELKYIYYTRSKINNHFLVILQDDLTSNGISLGKKVYFFQDHIEFEEIRSVWISNVDSEFLDSVENISNGLKRLRGLGFNTIYPVVWYRGFTFFDYEYKEANTNKTVIRSTKNTEKSDLADPQDNRINESLFGRDVLKDLIEANDELDDPFRIIPWFEWGLMAPENSLLAQTKTDWLIKTDNHETFILPTKDGKRVWLNPGNAEVKNMFQEMFKAIMNYKIAGIQLDDNFSIPQRYQKKNFFNLLLRPLEIDLPNFFSRFRNLIRNRSRNLIRIEELAPQASDLTNLLRVIFRAVKETSASKGRECIVSKPHPSWELEFWRDRL